MDAHDNFGNQPTDFDQPVHWALRLLPWTIDGQDEVEVAYTIAPSHWVRGLGTEAAQAILDYGFYTLGFTRLVCLIDGENIVLIRLAEKIGMAFEKASRDGIGPFWLYAKNRPLLR